MDDSSYSLCYAFPDESPSFTHGFEAGRIALCMQQALTPIEDGLPVHEANSEVFRRMANYYGYQIELTPSGVEGWLYLRAHKLILTTNLEQRN